MERYNPVVRERQRQHIRELMQQTPDELFRQMDKSICISNRVQAWAFDLMLLLLLQFKHSPYPTLNVGPYSWRFYVYMRRLQPKLCKEWRFCEKLRDPQNSDRVELAIALADFLVDKGIHRARIDRPAVALLSIDPKDLCGCEDS